MKFRSSILAGLLVLAPFLAHAEAGDFVVAAPGSLVVDLVEIGELRSLESRSVTAPFEWRAALQITHLVPEGIMVAAGDTLVRFDAAFLEREIAQVQNRIASDEAELRRVRASQASQRLGLENAITRAAFSVEQGELGLQKLGFESDSKRRSAELTLQKARVSLIEAQAKLAAQHVLDSLEVSRTELKSINGRTQLEREREQLASMSLLAPIDGLVVYSEWGGGDERRRIRFGDEVPPGATVVELPNLQEMEVVFEVHEVDREAIAPGTRAELRLDADPSQVFLATVTEVAKLALPPQEGSPVRRFRAHARIDAPDPALKPGFTATVRLRIAAASGILVPLEALFEVDGRPVVFPRQRWPKPVEVQLGARNHFHAVVEGLSGGEELARVPPPNADAQPLGHAAYVSHETEGSAP